MSRSQGTARTPGGTSSGRAATGRPATTGTQVTNLNQSNTRNNSSATNIDQNRRRDLEWTKKETDMQAYGLRQQGLVMAEFEERRERNINAPRQQRELAQKTEEASINANANTTIAGLQANANMFAAAQQAGAQKYSAEQQTKGQIESTKLTSAAQVESAKADERARTAVAGMDQTARLAQTKAEEKIGFRNMLGNLAASMGEKNTRRQESVISAATAASSNAASASNADADRMADIYKNIMKTYNTGDQQFKYW